MKLEGDILEFIEIKGDRCKSKGLLKEILWMLLKFKRNLKDFFECKGILIDFIEIQRIYIYIYTKDCLELLRTSRGLY